MPDGLNLLSMSFLREQISDHQQSWGYEEDPWKGPGHDLPVIADLYFI
jgi:hypothetical protein